MEAGAAILNFFIIIYNFGATAILNLKQYGGFAHYLKVTLTCYCNEAAIFADMANCVAILNVTSKFI